MYTSGNVKHCWRAGATQLGICPWYWGCITCRQRTAFLLWRKTDVQKSKKHCYNNVDGIHYYDQNTYSKERTNSSRTIKILIIIIIINNWQKKRKPKNGIIKPSTVPLVNISTKCTEGPRPHHEEVGGAVVRVKREAVYVLRML